MAYLLPYGNNIRSTYAEECERTLRLADGCGRWAWAPATG